MEIYTETADSIGYIGTKEEISSFAQTLGTLEQTAVREWRWWLGRLVEYDRLSVIRVVRCGERVADVMLDRSGEPFYIIANRCEWCTCDIRHHRDKEICAQCGKRIYWMEQNGE